VETKTTDICTANSKIFNSDVSSPKQAEKTMNYVLFQPPPLSPSLKNKQYPIPIIIIYWFALVFCK